VIGIVGILGCWAGAVVLVVRLLKKKAVWVPATVVLVSLCLCILKIALDNGEKAQYYKDLAEKTNASASHEPASSLPEQSAEPESAVSSAVQVSSAGRATSSAGQAASSAGQAASSAAKTTENQVLIDSDDVKITFTGLKDTDFLGLEAFEVSLKIENKSDKSLIVQTRNGSVNDVMCNLLMSSSIAARTTAFGKILIKFDDTTVSSIGEIKNIEWQFYVANASNFLDGGSTETVLIRPNQK
jgi:hypothetical protein